MLINNNLLLDDSLYSDALTRLNMKLFVVFGITSYCLQNKEREAVASLARTRIEGGLTRSKSLPLYPQEELESKEAGRPIF